MVDGGAIDRSDSHSLRQVGEINFDDLPGVVPNVAGAVDDGVNNVEVAATGADKKPAADNLGAKGAAGGGERLAPDGADGAADIEGGLESPEARKARMDREAIIQGLLNGRSRWEGKFFFDLVFYLKQTHVLMSIVGCHKMHPFQILERIVIYLAAVVGSYGVVIAFMDKTGKREDGIAIWIEGVSASFCVSCFTTIATKCLTCGCVQPGSCCAHRALRWIAEGVGRLLAITCVISAVIVLGIGIVVGRHHELNFWKATWSWGLAQVVNLKWGLLFEFFAFSFAYWRESRGALSQSKYPHGPSYPKDLEMLWGNDRCSCHRKSRFMAPKIQIHAPDAGSS